MLYKCALKITEVLKRYTTIKKDKECVYIYGLELLISTVITSISLIIISLILGSINYFFFFILFFFIQRLFCGGYHAKTYFKCFMLTNFIFILTYIFATLFYVSRFTIFIPVLVIVSFLIIIYYGPLKNKNHPYSERRYYQLRRLSRTISAISVSIWFSIYLFKNCSFELIFCAVSFSWVGILLIVENFKKLLKFKNTKFN